MASLLALSIHSALAQGQWVDFSKIQDVLKNDMLEQEVRKKNIKAKKASKKKKKRLVGSYNIPGESEFWSFMSEYWLVKNAQKVKWDVRIPDYGLTEGFAKFLSILKIDGQDIRLLFINANWPAHFSLPSNPGESILLMSVPFMRELDLSKLEIYTLLLQDYLRGRANYFRNFVSRKKVNVVLGKNFYRKKFNHKALEKMERRYNEMIFQKGFSFQQQYKVTNEMAKYLKSHLKLWSAYVGALKKIDELAKIKPEYKKYIKIYPSPELQLGWLNSR